MMGSNSNGEDERPEHRVYLNEFLIDKYEVSAEEFSRFLNDVSNAKGYYLDNKFGVLLYDGQFQPRTGLQSHPINNVKWKAARAYCRWNNKRLPTEAEWEKAARGTDQRPFPWGFNGPTPEHARYFQVWTEEIRHQVMASVYSMKEGQSPYGAQNMAGNVKEWVDDWFDREYYSDSSLQMNPKGPIGGEFKVLRGGSWRDLKGFIYSSYRNNSHPDTGLDDYGFRCAKSTTKDQPPKKLTRLEGFSKTNFR
jgi:sulfatase modifying factor 1